MPKYHFLRALDAEYKQKAQSAEKTFNEGIKRYNAGHYELALASFEQSTKIIWHNAEAYLNRAITYFSLGNYEEAIKINCDQYYRDT